MVQIFVVGQSLEAISTYTMYTLFLFFNKNREQNFSKTEYLFTETFVLQ